MPSSAPTITNRVLQSLSIVHNPIIGWAVLVGSLFLTVSAYLYTQKVAEQRAQKDFQFKAAKVKSTLAERMAVYEQVLNSGIVLFAASDSIRRSEWKAFVHALKLPQRFPGIKAVGFAMRVTASNLKAHTQEMREQGLANFTVHPAGGRSEYTSIAYIEPFNPRNQSALGNDMWTDRTKRAAMMRAALEATTATSGITVSPEAVGTSQRPEFYSFAPVYTDSPYPPDTADRRRTELRGWIYAVLDATDLMAGLFTSADNNFSFEVYDGEVRAESTRLYQSHHLTAHSDAHQDQFTTTETLVVHGHTWTLFYRANKHNLIKLAAANQPAYLLAGGLLVNLLLLYAIMSLRRINAHRIKTETEMRQIFEQSEANIEIQRVLIEAANNESETFFELAPEAFIIANRHGQIVKANPKAHALFKYKKGTMKGQLVESLIPQENRERHKTLRENYNRKPIEITMGQARQTLTAVKSNGDVFHVSIKISPMQYQGVPHVIAVVSDISTQKSTEAALSSAKDSAESASRSKSEFVANMSHEIRTPLNAVLGAVQLLEKTNLSELQRKYINMIRSSGASLLGIINDILDFSKIEAGAMELTSVEFSLDEVLTRVGVLMSINVGEKNLDLIIDVDTSVKQRLIGDPMRLQQVLINLSSNALKFTKSGHVVIYVEVEDSDKKKPPTDHQNLLFRIKDSGIGMTPEQQKKLFNAFSQADASTSREFGGTGLGLVISSKIMKLMDSSIKLHSQANLGSEFYFSVRLPVAEGLDHTREFLNDTPKHILILDDSDFVQHALKNIFSVWGWHIHACTTWASTLHELKDSGILPTVDFVLLDYNFSTQPCTEILQSLFDLGLKDTSARLLLLNNNLQATPMTPDEISPFNAHIVKPVLRSGLLDALQEASFDATGQGIYAAEQKQHIKTSKFNNLRILLAEDNIFNQTIAFSMLEDMGAKVELANNGAEVISMIQGSADNFDLILMDIQMPIMDGVAATRILRHNIGFTKPIIALTAGVLDSEKDHYLEAGMDNLIPKPIDENDLFKTISQAVQHRKHTPPLAADANPSEAQEPSSKAAVLAAYNTPETAEKNTGFDTNDTAESLKKTLDVGHLNSISAHCEQRKKRIMRSVTTIINDGESVIHRAVSNWHAGHIDQVKNELNNLKGVIRNYGGSELAVELNALINHLDEPEDTIKTLINTFLTQFQDYRNEARTWVDKQTPR